MPNYKYKCYSCNYVFEVEQRITEDVLKECPRCKSDIKRIISKGVNVIFKGSGFYSKDNNKKKGN